VPPHWWNAVFRLYIVDGLVDSRSFSQVQKKRAATHIALAWAHRGFAWSSVLGRGHRDLLRNAFVYSIGFSQPRPAARDHAAAQRWDDIMQPGCKLKIQWVIFCAVAAARNMKCTFALQPGHLLTQWLFSSALHLQHERTKFRRGTAARPLGEIHVN
jgi:hypothetical protein